ncbi:response regulator transcription factor [Jiella endophytica]|uniref:Response regulator transcription factor n=1 Tax=Jiella endophytica TaxID=2558362 RepID=A0A4Y8R8Q0_9HYPH|nr:response regulator transcription factor [Jiella endophytica]TFF17760.1 response regulator transcription factor [Jiella endophytica]
MSTVLLVDDHPVVREGYRRLIESRGRFQVVAEADTAAQAYRLYRTHEPDLAVVDLSLPGPGGLDAIRHIRQFDPAAKLLVFTMHQNPAYALKAFEAGAAGYVTKSSEPGDLLHALETVDAGGRALSPDIALALAGDRIDAARAPLSDLSPRETEILRLIALGHTDEAIAEALCLSLKTVQNNHYRIRAKLSAPTDAQLTHIALSAGIVGLERR